MKSHPDSPARMVCFSRSLAFILPFPPLRFALIVSHVLPLSSSLFDSHVHWLTSSTNGWQMAVRLRAEKCTMPGVTPLFYVTSFKPHSISSVKLSCKFIALTLGSYSRLQWEQKLLIFQLHIQCTWAGVWPAAKSPQCLIKFVYVEWRSPSLGLFCFSFWFQD